MTPYSENSPVEDAETREDMDIDQVQTLSTIHEEYEGAGATTSSPPVPAGIAKTSTPNPL